MINGEPVKRKPMHIQMFIAFVVFGCAFLFPNMRWLFDGHYYPFTMIMASTIIPMGVAMRIFKGAEPGTNVVERQRGFYYLKKAPLRSKLMWWLFGLLGAALGFWLFLMDAVEAR